MRGFDPLEAAFESDLAAWLAWLKAARDARADQHAMRRLELVYGAGWTAVGAAIMATPLVGVAGGVLSVVFFGVMLALGLVVTEPDWPHSTDRAADQSQDWSGFGPVERATLVRIINLSRVATRAQGVWLLLSEVDDALAAEPLASWPPLSELRELVRSGCARLVPFVSEAYPREGQCVFAGHVP